MTKLICIFASVTQVGTLQSADMKKETANEDKRDESKTPDYRLLGESGLVEDEEGNIYSASEIYDDEEQEETTQDRKPSTAARHSSFVDTLDDKVNPAYWYYHYDPRYCGPSREAYMEEMARRYRQKSREPKEEQSAATVADVTPKTGAFVTHEVRMRFDQQQRMAEREGLRPDFHRYNNSRSTCGMVNRHNQVIISYDEYDNIGFFHDGLARVLKKKTGKFGFVDIHGKEVIPCVWRSAGEFCDYIAGVQNDEKKCGYIDVTGRVVIPCQWKNTYPFCEGLAAVEDFNKHLGFINRRGELVIPCRYKRVEFFKNGRARVTETNHFFRKNVWVYIDKQGREIK